MEGHCTRGRPLILRRQACAPTCQSSPSLRVVACAYSALARYCARFLWGRGPACTCSALARHCARSLRGRVPARAPPTRARPKPSRRHPVHTLRKGTARARCRRSFGVRPVLPRASPPSHCAWWLARVARLRATALALSGDEAQHAHFRRARAPSQAGDTRPIPYRRALHEREAAVPLAPGPRFHVPALPLTARGGLRV